MATEATDTNASEQPPEKKKHRRRRWLLIAGGLVLVLLILVALGPTILSTDFGRTRVLDYAGTKTGTKLTAGRLSLSWFGRQGVGDLAMDTADGEPILRVGTFDLDQGLWSLAWGARPGAMTVSETDVYLARARTLPGRLGLKEEEEKPEKPPTVPLKVTIENIRIHAADASIRVESAEFSAAAENQMADTFKGRVELQHKDRTGTATFNGRLTGLTKDWQGSDKVGVEADAEVADVPLAALWSTIHDMGVDVRGGGTLSRANMRLLRSRDGTTQMNSELHVADAWATGDALSGDRPTLDRLDLTANLEYADRLLRVDTLTLDSPVAEASASGTFGLPAPDAEDRAEASGTATFKVHLSHLAGMFPSTLNLHKDLKLTGGTLDGEVRMQRTPQASTLAVDTSAHDITGTRGTRSVTLDPMQLQARLRRTDDTVTVEKLTGTTTFATLRGSGQLDDFAATATVDLAKAAAQASQLVDTEGWDAAGSLQTELRTRRPAENTWRVVVDAAGTDVRLLEGGTLRWREPGPRFDASTDLVFAGEGEERRLAKLDATSTLDVAAGTFESESHLAREGDSWTVDSTTDGSGALAALADQLARYTGGAARIAGGTWDLTVKAAGRLDRVLTTTFAAHARDIRIGQPAAEAAAGRDPVFASPAPANATTTAFGDLSLSGTVKRHAKENRIEARDLALEGPGMQAAASGEVTLPPKDSPRAMQATGTADGTFDLGRLVPLARSFGLVRPGSRGEGAVEFDTDIATENDVVTAEGTLEATDVDVYLAANESRIQESKLTAPFNLTYRPKTRRLVFAADDISGTLVSGSLRADVDRRPEVTALDATFDLASDGTAARAALGNRAPADLDLGKTYRVAGDIKGPVPREGRWFERIANLTGSGRIETGTFEMQGLHGDEGVIHWQLAERYLRFRGGEGAASGIPVNNGTVRPAGYVDLTRESPHWVVDEKTAVVDGVELNEELSSRLLVYLSPLVGYSVAPSGRLQLDVTSADLPLDETLKTRGKAQGAFTIPHYKARLKGPIALIARYVGARQEVEEQTFGPVPIDFREGRFHLKNQSLHLPGNLPLNANGTVGADGDLKLMINVPLTQSLLERVGVPVKDKSLFVDTIVRIPVGGTVSKPKVDESRIFAAVLGTVKDSLLEGGKGIENIGKLIGDLIRGGEDEDGENEATLPPEDEAPPAANQPPEEDLPADDEAPADPRSLIDGVLDLLKPSPEEAPPPEEGE